MKEAIKKARMVQNTIQTLVVPATFDNMNRLLGMYQALEEIINELETEAEKDEADAE